MRPTTESATLRHTDHRPRGSFAGRARPELFAIGETVRKRRDDTRDQLTPPEEQTARLALAGRTNQESAASSLSAHANVEWHLSVFTKRGIGARKRLDDAAYRPARMPLRQPNSAVAIRP